MSVVVVSRSETDDPARRRCEEAVAFLAAGAGHDVITVPHLYHLAEDAAVWRTLAAVAADGQAVAVLAWMHPRPIEALLQRHDAWRERHRAFDLATAAPDALWPQVEAVLDPPQGCGGLSQVEEDAAPRWHPVVDWSRCVQCRHCLQFCIFGVYALDAHGQVQVVQPDNCKPGCPACSRICPHSAIMFPLYGKDPAIAGAPGLTVQPDAATRRMWYQRTGDACPRCHQAGKGRGAGAGEPCPECGRAQPAGGAPADDLDGLIADLDRLDGGRHG